MKLYPKNATEQLDMALFRNPSAEYRGTPFWSWNCKLERSELLRQIAMLREMGMGGFHIHSRTGLATPYMGEEFIGLVRECVEEAQRSNMLAWLYDEDRWPSGFGGGMVTSDPQLRSHHLLFTCVPYGEPPPPAAPGPSTRAAGASRTGNGRLLARYQIVLRDGCLATARRLAEDEAAPAEGTVWYAYLESTQPTPWFNNQGYVDTLNPAATRRFIETTHEPYAAALGEYFGGVIPAIFTDEPQYPRKHSLPFAADRCEVVIPWTPDFYETYRATYGEALEDHLPELFWELPDGVASVARYRYHDHLTERFATAFAGVLGAWCEGNNLLLTGHMMEEPRLDSQTTTIGEAMRSLWYFGLPGIDMLCDRREYTTTKQAQSVAHQGARPGVLSELYGVTNWDYDFVGHRAQGDWQAALDVTVRVHHLTWLSMAGDAKRDYPASIGDHSPWWQEYAQLEDHFSRLNTVLTRGTPRVRVGVVHPIESYWLCCGPYEQTTIERDERERNFADVTRWLLHGLIDFDYVAESLLPLQTPADADMAAGLPVGAMRYDALVVPSLRTIRSSTLERLERFRDAGGTLSFAGDVPTLVDAAPSDRAQRLAERSAHIPLSEGRLLAALAPFREVSARLANGRPADSLLHQIRDDGERRFVFFCNTDRLDPRPATEITLPGAWQATMLDTFSGERMAIPAHQRNGATVITWDFAAHGTLLLQLDPGTAEVAPLPRTDWRSVAELADSVPVTLSEPNMLLLDQPEFRLNDGAWRPAEEVLRLGAVLRSELGWPARSGRAAQPWTQTAAPEPRDTLHLRFMLQVDVAVEAPQLALEDAATARITLDGAPVANAVVGWFVDRAITTVALPRLGVGSHALEISLPFGQNTTPEWCYLLGDFGVVVQGRHARIIAPVRALAWGDWGPQGLPFYAGNVTYHCTLEGGAGRSAIHAPHFRSPLLAVGLDGERVGPLAWAPFQVELGVLAPGQHTLDITAYGNRMNAFGCIHNANAREFWFGPLSWRTTGDNWSYEYNLRPMGVMTAPHVLIATD